MTASAFDKPQRLFRVTLDGEDVSAVAFAASSEHGWVCMYIRDDNGKIIIAQDLDPSLSVKSDVPVQNGILMKTAHGVVTVEYI